MTDASTARRDLTFRPVPFHLFPKGLPAPAADGLVVLPVKDHSLAKLEALGRYCNAFSTALKGKRKTYIDLFAGPGLLQRKDGSLVWGSPLIALQCPAPFETVICVEQVPERYKALRQRAHRTARRGERLVMINCPAEAALETVIEHSRPGILHRDGGVPPVV